MVARLVPPLAVAMHPLFHQQLLLTTLVQVQLPLTTLGLVQLPLTTLGLVQVHLLHEAFERVVLAEPSRLAAAKLELELAAERANSELAHCSTQTLRSSRWAKSFLLFRSGFH